MKKFIKNRNQKKETVRRNAARNFLSAAALLISFFVLLPKPAVFAELGTDQVEKAFLVLEGEILDVEESSEAEMSGAVLVIRDFASGETHRFFADPYQTTIQIGQDVRSIRDVIGGSRAKAIYRNNPLRSMPELIYVKVTGAYQP